MSKRSLIVAAVLAAALLLAGCSASSGPAQPPASAEASNPTPQPTTVPAGKSFDYTSVGDDQTKASNWTVKLTKTECGVKSISKAVPNPNYDGSEDAPEYVAAEPAKGRDFCILHWSWKNVGKTPGYADAAGDLEVNGERYAREEDEMSEHVMETHLGIQWHPTNPHQSTKSLDIYEVPAGSTPDAVWFPYENLVVPDSYLLIATH